MVDLKKCCASFWHNEEGATAIEYGLIAALVGIGIISSLSAFSSSNNSIWNIVGREVTNVMDSPSP